MKVRAAVLEEFGQPLVVQEIELGTERRRGAGAARSLRGLPHRSTRVGRRSDGIHGLCARPRGRRRRGEGWARRHARSARRPRGHPLRARVGSACTASIRARTAASRSATSRASASCRTARRDSPERQGHPALHGHVDLRRVHGRPRDRAREGEPDAPLAACAPFACGLSTGMGAALYTALVTPGSTCVVFGCGLVGLGAVIGCRLAGADRIVAVDLEDAARGAAPRSHPRAWPPRTSWTGSGPRPAASNFTFEATRNVQVMQQAVEAAREAWGSQR